MAAIIAQLSFRNRARRKRLLERKNYSASKCLYTLQPFDQSFNPAVHNKYIRGRKGDDLIEAEVEQEFLARIQKRKTISSLPKFTWTRFFIEVLIIGMHILFIKGNTNCMFL